MNFDAQCLPEAGEQISNYMDRKHIFGQGRNIFLPLQSMLSGLPNVGLLSNEYDWEQRIQDA